MKKNILFFVAIAVFALAGIVSNANTYNVESMIEADIPDCLDNGDGCIFKGLWYPCYKEKPVSGELPGDPDTGELPGDPGDPGMGTD